MAEAVSTDPNFTDKVVAAVLGSPVGPAVTHLSGLVKSALAPLGALIDELFGENTVSWALDLAYDNFGTIFQALFMVFVIWMRTRANREVRGVDARVAMRQREKREQEAAAGRAPVSSTTTAASATPAPALAPVEAAKAEEPVKAKKRGGKK